MSKYYISPGVIVKKGEYENIMNARDEFDPFVIGVMEDILAGKLLGSKTILVDSINAHNEGKATRFVRWLERRFILE